MRDLYTRLKAVGFDAPFVRQHVLPDWWDDSLANVPANRAMAEASISRMLGLSLHDLHNPRKLLHLPTPTDVRLKRRKGAKPSEAAPSILLAYRTAATVVGALADIPSFSGPQDANAVRREILMNRDVVDLESLLEFAWSSGIVVIHLRELPNASKKIAGMALFCDRTPVIVLASRRDSPPWLAFHLSHELGHIMLGHVDEGSAPLADGDIDEIGTDAEEAEADAFACATMIDDPRPTVGAVYGMTAPKLAACASQISQTQQIDAGAIALVYGRSAKRMAVAQSALKLLGVDRGAHDAIAAALERHLVDEDRPEFIERLLSLVSLG